jgi:hypothetical protein
MAREIADPISTAIAVASRRRRPPNEDQAQAKRSRPKSPQVGVANEAASGVVAVPPPTEAYGEAILTAQMYPAHMSAREHQLRVAAGWNPPASNLRLRDRTV